MHCEHIITCIVLGNGLPSIKLSLNIKPRGRKPQQLTTIHLGMNRLYITKKNVLINHDRLNSVLSNWRSD